MATATASREQKLDEFEDRFRRAGLPLFSEDFGATTDVWNRALPILGLVFIAELLGAGQLAWSWWQNALAIGGALVFMLAAIALANRMRGHPLSVIPRTIDTPELAGFVLLPALLPVVFGAQLGSATFTLLGNLAILGLIYTVGASGLPAILRWVLSRIAMQLRSSIGLIAKAVPLLAIFVLLSFPTQELWGIFSHPTRGIFAVLVGLFIFLAIAFLVARIPAEARRLEQEVGEGPPLHRRELFNVGLVMLVSQALQVLVVSLFVFAFLTVFGVLAIDDDLRTQWLGYPGHEILHFQLLGERLELTSPLLRVAAGLAAFSGFYFAIAIFTDEAYRTEFLDELTGEMRDSFKARATYIKLRGAK
jgi:hypothetical protein